MPSAYEARVCVFGKYSHYFSDNYELQHVLYKYGSDANGGKLWCTWRGREMQSDRATIVAQS